MQWRAPWAGSRHRLFFLKRGVGALLFHLMLNVMFSVDTAKRITLAGGRKGGGPENQLVWQISGAGRIQQGDTHDGRDSGDGSAGYVCQQFPCQPLHSFQADV